MQIFYDEFTQWIKQHKNAFINPAELMLWNSHKGYLCDLQNWGVNVIPTIICSTKTSEILTALESQDWPEFVIKPAVGQSGNLVTKLKQGEYCLIFLRMVSKLCYSPLFLKWRQMVKLV